MQKAFMLTGAAFMTFAGFIAAQAQPNPLQGTPTSLFPYAAPNEVQIINAIP